MRRVASFLSCALVVVLPACAVALTVFSKPAPKLGYYAEGRDWSGKHGFSHETIARPCFNAKGTRLYYVASHEIRQPHWRASARKVSQGKFEGWGGVADLPYSERRQDLAVVPSPDESRLALLLKLGDRARLAVASRSSRRLKRLEKGLDQQRSQLAWSSDGTFIYYSLPVETGEDMALRRVTPDGETLETLIGEGLTEFDVARKADRVVALAGGKLLVLEAGKVTETFEPEGLIEGVRISPDGTKVAWGGRRIVVFDLTAGKVVASTKEPEGEAATDRKPAWRPDGGELVFERAFHLGDAEGPVLTTSLAFFDPASGTERELERRSFVRSHIEWCPAGDLIVWEYMEAGAQDALQAKHYEPTELVPAPEGARWTQTHGPYGANVRSFAVAPSDGRIVYAHARGLYVTEDGAASWRRVNMQPRKKLNGEVSDIAVDPRNPKIVYAAAGNKLWRSEDGGTSWALFCPKDKEWSALQIAVHPTEPDVVYALRGGRRLVRYSSRQTSVISEWKNASASQVSVDGRNPDLVVLSDRWRSQRVVMFSTDGGATWRNAVPPAREQGILFITGDAQDEQLLLAQATSGRVYFSTDGGENLDLYADPEEPGLWIDQVRTVVEASFPLPAVRPAEGWVGEPLSAQRDAQNPKRIYVSVRGQGLYRSDDGGKEWHPANAGLGRMPIGAFVVAADRPGWVVIIGPRVMTTSDGGESWQPSAIPPGYLGNLTDFAAHPDVPGLMFFSAANYAVTRSTDYGETWEKILGNYKTFDVGFDWRFTFDRQDRDHIMVYAQGGVLESKDGGTNWKVVSKFAPLPRRFYRHQIVGSGNVITVCERQNWRVFQSRDLGKTWRVLDGPFRGRRPTVMTRRPEKSGALYIVTEYDWHTEASVLWASGDLGDTWEARPLPKRFGHASVLACSPVVPETLAIGLDDGTVWLSLDDGKQWRDLGAGLPANKEVVALVFSPADDRLYAVLRDAGVFWIEVPAGD